MRGVFVTGTDTEVGKTIVSAVLVAALRSKVSVRYWKPIQTGIEMGCDTATVRKLASCANSEYWDTGYRLQRPLSPHLSARMSATRIDIGNIMKRIARRKDDFFWIVEGAGGVMVPLNERETMLDLVGRFRLPVLVVARSTLGTINHTLLTIEALERRDLNIAGIVMNGGTDVENRNAIEHYGRVKVLVEIPQLPEPLAENLNTWATENRDAFDVLHAG